MKRVVFFIKFDLKSGYHHLDIFPEHQPYLGFSWVTPDMDIKFFMFTVLPFGLSSAPYIFTKLFRPLVKHWRSKGIHSVLYLDDGVDVERSEAFSSTNSNIIKSDLASAGFLANSNSLLGSPTWSGHIIAVRLVFP